MREVFRMAWEVYGQFIGAGMHMGLFFAALLFLNGTPKANAERARTGLLSWYSVFFFGIYFFPVTAKIIMEYCIGADVYWRMFWILPLPMVVAYGFAFHLKPALPWRKKAALVAGAALVIAVTGSAVYTPQNFSKADNIYKIPQNVVDLCDRIEEDATMRGISDKKAIVVNELLPYVRQYDAEICMPYGRNALRNKGFENKNSKKIYQVMCSPQPDLQSLKKYSQREACNYLVYYKDNLAREALCGLGYEVAGELDAYTIFYLNLKDL
ncbi:MAG: hypothetical protein HFH39_03200 [Lachnospiraceae bacterium]|nr:hypothetical protein [Lachnospiraceae bacterium]